MSGYISPQQIVTKTCSDFSRKQTVWAL